METQDDFDGTSKPSIVLYNVSEYPSKSTSKINTSLVQEKNRTRTKQKYRPSWENDPKFGAWLAPDPTSEYKALCKACNTRFISELTVLKNHAKGSKHLKRLTEFKRLRTKERCKVVRPRIKKELVDHSEYIRNFSMEGDLDGELGTREDARDLALMKLVKIVEEMSADKSATKRVKDLVGQCLSNPSSKENMDLPSSSDPMSRHVPLTCRDPFFRDLDRDFFGDHRPSRANWFDSSNSKIFDQHFGTGIWPDDVNTGTSSLYLRSRRPPREKSGVSYVSNVKEKFSIMLDVPHFTPDELKVRVAGNSLEIEGKHEERPDEHGSIARHFTRKYNLPEDVMVDMISSSLAADGVLTIEAPRKPPEPPRPSEREVPIQKTEKRPQ